MRKLLVIAVCLVSFLLLAPTSQAAESITSFASEISIEQGSSIRIKETIQYTTDEYHHGIYRYIPTRYHGDQGWIETPIADVRVEDPSGRAYEYESEYEGGNLFLKIGDADKTFTGNQTYVISYEVQNALRWGVPGNEGPELYWDITGEGWQLPIELTTAVIRSPHAALLRSQCYSGAIGTNDLNCTVAGGENVIQLTYAQPLAYGDNVTIAVELDPNSSLQLAPWWVRRRRELAAGVATAIALWPAVLMTVWWWLRGRDWAFQSWNVFAHEGDRPKHRAPVMEWRNAPMVYEPLQDLSPGEAGALLRDSVQAQDVVAEILELARKGFLKIEREEKKKLLGKDVEYWFHKLKEPTAKLPVVQTYLMERIFAGRESTRLSTLRGTFAANMEKAKKHIEEQLVAKDLYLQNPATVRGWAFLTAGLLEMFALVVAFIVLDRYMLWQPLVVAIVSGGVGAWFALHMPAKSAPGNNLEWQARGLRESLRRGAWRQKIHEKHLFFADMLPFAVALGVVGQLAKDMEELDVAAPEYLGGSNVNALSAAGWVNSFTSTASSSLAYSPSSSSGSGSGFSGGSSGGGGGGGGGGSW